MPTQKISSNQMKQRSEKRLCYYYDSKWSLGHKCSSSKLFLIEDVEEEVLGDGEEEEESRGNQTKN